MTAELNSVPRGGDELDQEPATPAEVARPATRAILRVIFVVLAVVAVLWTLYALEEVLLLLVLAIFFAYLIAPLVEIVRRPFKLLGRDRVMPRTAAICVVYAAIFGSIGLGGYLLLPRVGEQVTQLANQAPNYIVKARARLRSYENVYQRYPLPPSVREALDNTAARTLEAGGEYVRGGLLNAVAHFGYVPWLILVPVLAFFLLKDAKDFRRAALLMLPRGPLRSRGAELFQDVNNTLAAYIRAQLTACFLIGSLCTVGFVLLGVPYALLLGLVAGMLEFIPLVGPLVVALLAAILCSFYSFGKVVGVLLFLAILRIIHDYAIYPRLIGLGIHLHPLAVILAILCGAELAGVAGIFLAIPVIAVLSVTYRHWMEHRGSAGLVADLLTPVEQIVNPPPTLEPEAVPRPAPASTADATSQ